MSTGPHHPRAVDNRHTKRPPPAGERGSVNSASWEPTRRGRARLPSQPRPTTRTSHPERGDHPSDEPSWHQLLGTLLSSQRTDAHPPLTLAGSWPEARFQSTRVSGPFRSRFPRLPVPPLYQSFWFAFPFPVRRSFTLPEFPVRFAGVFPARLSLTLPGFPARFVGVNSDLAILPPRSRRDRPDAEAPAGRAEGVATRGTSHRAEPRCPFLPAGRTRRTLRGRFAQRQAGGQTGPARSPHPT